MGQPLAYPPRGHVYPAKAGGRRACNTVVWKTPEESTSYGFAQCDGRLYRACRALVSILSRADQPARKARTPLTLAVGSSF